MILSSLFVIRLRVVRCDLRADRLRHKERVLTKRESKNINRIGCENVEKVVTLKIDGIIIIQQ